MGDDHVVSVLTAELRRWLKRQVMLEEKRPMLLRHVDMRSCCSTMSTSVTVGCVGGSRPLDDLTYLCLTSTQRVRQLVLVLFGVSPRHEATTA